MTGVNFRIYDEPVSCKQCTTRILIIDSGILKGHIFYCSQCLTFDLQEFKPYQHCEITWCVVGQKSFLHRDRILCTSKSLFLLKSVIWEGFSIECCLTKTQVVTLVSKKELWQFIQNSMQIHSPGAKLGKNICLQVAIAFGLTFDWLRRWREFTFKPITKLGNSVNP